MTPQEIFDTGVRAIIAQGGAGMSKTGGCMYYASDTNRRCIAGHLVPLEVAKSLQRKSYGSIEDFAGKFRSTLPDGVPRFFKDDFGLIRSMQRLHDLLAWNDEACRPRTDAEFMKVFVPMMRSLAVDNGLSPYVLDEDMAEDA